MGIWCSSIHVMTPTWARPSAPPPCNARPRVGRFWAGGACWAFPGSEEKRISPASRPAWARNQLASLKEALIVNSCISALTHNLHRAFLRLVQSVQNAGLAHSGSRQTARAAEHRGTRITTDYGFRYELTSVQRGWNCACKWNSGLQRPRLAAVHVARRGTTGLHAPTKGRAFARRNGLKVGIIEWSR